MAETSRKHSYIRNFAITYEISRRGGNTLAEVHPSVTFTSLQMPHFAVTIRLIMVSGVRQFTYFVAARFIMRQPVLNLRDRCNYIAMTN